MITDIFRMDDNVPRIYVNESRDFQMLCRLFTYALNTSKYEAETLHYLNSGMLTNDRLLNNLCEKPGFMDGEGIKGEYLRYITENFGRLVRDKGAEVGILNSVYLYLLMYNLATSVVLNIDKVKFIIHIGIESTVRDIDVLYTILKYIVPIGWIIDIFFFAKLEVWQGYRYKDTIINLISKASAKNAMYIINTTGGNLTSSDGDNFIGSADTTNRKHPKGYNKGDFKTSHILRYAGRNKQAFGLALNAMSTSEIASLLEDPERLQKYGAELWDANYARYTWAMASRNADGSIDTKGAKGANYNP